MNTFSKDIQSQLQKKLIREINEIMSDYSERQLHALNQRLRREPAVNIVEEYLRNTYDIRENVIDNRFEYALKNTEEFVELNVDEINRELQKKKINFSLNSLKSLLKSNFVPKYNPFEDYFTGLTTWQLNKHKDYIGELASYVQAKDQNRFNQHFKKHLVRTVACALLPNVINKQCLVLTGGQNSGKTTFCRFLVPDRLNQYIAENIDTDKDGLIALGENLWINMDELATLNKKEINALKSLFSKDKVKVRKPYGDKPTTAPRVASFMGSTNSDEFLSDETGSVRWLCFEIESIDFDYRINCHMDQVYAQAYALFKDGFDYNLSKEEIKENETINRRHHITTMEMELLSTQYKPIVREDFYPENSNNRALTTTELLSELQEGKQVKLSQHNLSKALKYLGFVQINKRKGGMPLRVWLLDRNSDDYEDITNF